MVEQNNHGFVDPRKDLHFGADVSAGLGRFARIDQIKYHRASVLNVFDCTLVKPQGLVRHAVPQFGQEPAQGVGTAFEALCQADAIAEYYNLSPKYALGDVNADGKVNHYDYILIKRIVMGTYKPTDEELRRCDINGDGKVDKYDYLTLKRIVLNS